MATPDLKKNPRLAGEIAKNIAEDFYYKESENQEMVNLATRIAKACIEDVKTSKLHIVAQVIKTERLRENLQKTLDNTVLQHPLPEPGMLVVIAPKDKRDPHSITDWVVDFNPHHPLSDIKTYGLIKFMEPENFNMLYRDCFTN